MLQIYRHNSIFQLEQGGKLESLEIGFHTYGTLNAAKDNVVWICHALTANADVADWWSGLVGEKKTIDPAKYFIVCANILGSCYGSTGPNTTNPNSGKIYGIDFPFYTIRDMVNAHELLRQHLGIEQIKILVGGSMGGYQALEWTLQMPNAINNLFLLATSAAESAWGIGIHTAQRMAIATDPEWTNGTIGSGDNGLKAARAIGMLTYRNYELFNQLQTDDDVAKTASFKASSYLQYQAQKLANRFDAVTYYKLTEAMDSHNIARGRASDVASVLKTIQHKTLLIGISTDILCPPKEQQILAQHIPNCTYYEIDSQYGHDGFLIEYEKIGQLFEDWLK